MPLNEQKLNQTDENELMSFKHARQAMGGRGSAPASAANLNAFHNRLRQQLYIRIINEEDKYIYLINKLKECPRFVRKSLFFSC